MGILKNHFLCLWLEFQTRMYFFFYAGNNHKSNLLWDILGKWIFFLKNKIDNQLWLIHFPTLFGNILENFSIYIYFFPSVLFILELSFFFPSISSFSILGPLTKKQTDDLGDNDGAEDEGIFFHQFYLHDKGLSHFFHPFLFFYLSFLKNLFLIPVFDVFCLLACCYI